MPRSVVGTHLLRTNSEGTLGVVGSTNQYLRSLAFGAAVPANTGMGERSPEKAGVGGSIPSLATTFSITYTHPKLKTCSILFHKAS